MRGRSWKRLCTSATAAGRSRPSIPGERKLPYFCPPRQPLISLDFCGTFRDGSAICQDQGSAVPGTFWRVFQMEEGSRSHIRIPCVCRAPGAERKCSSEPREGTPCGETAQGMVAQARSLVGVHPRFVKNPPHSFPKLSWVGGISLQLLRPKDGPSPNSGWLEPSRRVAPGRKKEQDWGMEIVSSVKGLCFPSLFSSRPNKKVFIASFRHLLVGA